MLAIALPEDAEHVEEPEVRSLGSLQMFTQMLSLTPAYSLTARRRQRAGYRFAC